MGGACGTNGKKRNAYRLLVGRQEGKSPLGRPRSRWMDNIWMDLGEIGFGGRGLTAWVRLRIGTGGELL
jgi:hypothetical protein